MKHWYPKHVGDYARKTQGLSLIQHGAYNLLLDHYYAHHAPIPADEGEIFRICRAVTTEEQNAARSVISKFFQLRDGFFINKRAEEEIKKAKVLAAKRRKAQAAGEKKKRERRKVE